MQYRSHGSCTAHDGWRYPNGLSGFGITGPWAWIGIVPLITGMLGNCPAYSVLGISTSNK